MSNEKIAISIEFRLFPPQNRDVLLHTKWTPARLILSEMTLILPSSNGWIQKPIKLSCQFYRPLELSSQEPLHIHPLVVIFTAVLPQIRRFVKVGLQLLQPLPIQSWLWLNKYSWRAQSFRQKQERHYPEVWDWYFVSGQIVCSNKTFLSRTFTAPWSVVTSITLLSSIRFEPSTKYDRFLNRFAKPDLTLIC